MRSIKVIFAFLSLTVMLVTVEIVLRLPTDQEVALVGPDHARSEIAQMRLARMILALDPERGSYALASLTGADAALVRQNLRFMAKLDMEVSGDVAAGYTGSADLQEEPAEPDLPRIRRMSSGGGGARFMRVN